MRIILVVSTIRVKKGELFSIMAVGATKYCYPEVDDADLDTLDFKDNHLVIHILPYKQQVT